MSGNVEGRGRPLRIVHLYRDIAGPGGVPYEARSLAEAQSRLGHNVALVGCLPQNNSEVIHPSDAVELIGVPRGLAGRSEVERVVDAFEPDILQYYSLWIPENIIWWNALRSRQIPYVLAPHGALNPATQMVRFGGRSQSLPHRFKKTMWRTFVDTPFLKGASLIQALSKYEQELAAENGLNATFIAPNGFDVARGNDVPNIRDQSVTTFLFLGRLDVFQKGLDLILDACESLAARGYQNRYRVLLVGPHVGRSSDYLRGRLKQPALSNVLLPGPLYGTGKLEAFGKAHWFLHPSRFEGMARAAREAVSAGVPAIASRESNFGDWVGATRAGKSVDLSVDGLAGALQEAIEGPEGQDEASANARRLGEKNTWDAVGQGVVRAYAGTLE